MQRRLVFAAATAALFTGSALSQAAFAQEYPTRPIKITVPFAVGGDNDVLTRLIAEPLSKFLGQPVVVDNRVGAGGAIGATETARATPDGYTLGVASVSTVATNPAVNPKNPYNPLTDFTPIVSIAGTPAVLAVNPGFPAKDFKSFIDTVKAAPGKYSYASSGTGGLPHLQMELFKSLAGIDVVHVPYRGTAPALTDAVAGQVPMVWGHIPTTGGYIRDSRLVPIAIAAPGRLSWLPDVPTFKEVGYEQANRMAFVGIVGPKGLPKEVVEKVNSGVMKALADPAVRKRIEDLGWQVIGNTPEQFSKQIAAEFETYKKVVETANIKLD